MVSLVVHIQFPTITSSIYAPTRRCPYAHCIAQSISDPTPICSSPAEIALVNTFWRLFLRIIQFEREHGEESAKREKSRKNKLRLRQRVRGDGDGSADKDDRDNGASFVL